MTLTTTLAAIRTHDPCKSGWRKLLAHLGKTKADDEPLPILTILESNGLDDALWSLRAVEGQDRLIRHLACDFAEHVLLPLHEREQLAQRPYDDRPRRAIEVARRYADQKATSEELSAARVAADDAARAAAWAAVRAVACAAARDAAQDAAWAAAWDAAWAAARAAARDAVSAAARATAWATASDAVRQWQADRLRLYCIKGEAAIGTPLDGE